MTPSGVLPERPGLRLPQSGPEPGARQKEPEVLASLDESALCELALRGRREAWDVLIKRHNHRVVVSLLARGLRIDRAQEIAQDTWARLIEQQRDGRLPRLSLPGLAVTQATFLLLDDARRRQPGQATAEGGLRAALDVPDPAAGIEERLLSREQLGRAQQALSACSGSAQRVFKILYDNPSISHAEAALQVGLSLQRVRQIICEVRKRLRVAIEDEVHE